MSAEKYMVHVSLGNRSYTINFVDLIINPNTQKNFLNILNNYSQAVWITNQTIYKIYNGFLDNINVNENNNNLLLIPDGEEYKSWQILETIMTSLLQKKLDRKSVLVAFGGGVVGDIIGLASALYQRGIDFIQIPSTLLAMVDSSIGGKTAVNHPLGKNMLGVIKQPTQVLIDSELLKTLPDREFSAGLAEVVKYGLLGDKEFFEWLVFNSEKIINREPKVLIPMINKCCKMKARIVESDENEQGERALLNLGHTFGHAIEALTHYKKFLHGEAVAIGMVIAGQLSQLLGNISDEELAQIKNLLNKFGLPTNWITWQQNLNSEDFLSQMNKMMSLDKKNQAGSLRLIILAKIGSAEIRNDINPKLINQAILSI